MDSLGVSAIKIRCIIAPDRRRHRQEALKHIPVTPVGFLGFFVGFVWRGGVGGHLCSFQPLHWGWGALKDKIHAGGFLTTWCIYPLPWAYSSETSQGVPLDSLGVGAIKIRRIIAPDPSLMLPASAEAHSGGGGSVFAFLDCISMAWGPGGLPLFVPCAAMLLWGLKEQDIWGSFLTTHVFWVFMCLWHE